jgi:hypothetical protein
MQRKRPNFPLFSPLAPGTVALRSAEPERSPSRQEIVISGLCDVLSSLQHFPLELAEISLL